MAVETLSGPYASVVGPGHGLSGDLKVAFGYYVFDTTAVEDGDIRKLNILPANILVVGGYFITDNIDSNATETLDIDVGWAANGGGSAVYTDTRSGVSFTNAGASADADGFAKGGVLTADAVAGLVADGFAIRPYTILVPKYFSHRTQVQAEVNAAAATMGGGTLTAYTYYIQL